MATTDERTILHVDMDAFFASVELLRHPELRGKPVAVGGTGDRGVVAAASYEARAYGVRSAMASVRARRLCPDLVFLPGDHAHYGQVSARIMDIFRSVTPLVEPLSLDEAFLDVIGYPAPARARRRAGRPHPRPGRRTRGPDLLGRGCTQQVPGEVGLRVGEAPRRRRRSAGGFGRPGRGAGPGACVPPPAPGRTAVGRGTGHARQAGAHRGPHRGGPGGPPRRGAHLGHRRGLGPAPPRPGLGPSTTDPSSPTRSPSRSATRRPSRSTATASTSCAADLVRMADAVASRLRRHGYRGRTVQLKVRYGDFTTVSRSRTLGHATDRGTDLVAHAWDLLGELPVSRGVRLLGVGVTNLTSEAPVVQLSLDELRGRSRVGGHLGCGERRRRCDPLPVRRRGHRARPVGRLTRPAGGHAMGSGRGRGSWVVTGRPENRRPDRPTRDGCR